jgi:hypothetical protein
VFIKQKEFLMCKRKAQSVKNLSSKDLARLLLRLLWQRYDVGGISMGRAPESRLLESAMELLPLPGVPDTDSFLLDDMIKEGRARLEISSSGSQMFFSQGKLIYLSDSCVAYLVLKKLSELFGELERSRGYPVPPHEKEIISVAEGLLSIDMTESTADLNNLLGSFSREDLLLEVDDRVYITRENKSWIF